MRKKRLNKAWILLFAGLITLCLTSQSFAFEPVSFKDTELNVYGFLRNNYGYFLEDADYTYNEGDKVATNRTWLRLNVDYRMSDTFSLFFAGQLVYEPEYDVETGSVSKPDGEEYSEYDDANDVVRELYFDWQPSSQHSYRVGRQIVIWGESLTTRIGDVVNPLDTRYSFAFANWEDTRIPQWMIKGDHVIDSAATSVEWLVNPNLTGQEYRVNRTGAFAVPGAGEFVGQRFGIHPEDRHLPPYAVGNPAINQPVASSPFSRGWIYNPFAPGTGYVPTEIPHVEDKYPEDDLDALRYGFRTSTLLGGYEFGASYFHTQMYQPVVQRSNETSPTGLPLPAPQNYRNYYLVYPDIDYFGVYGNKDFAVGVLRAEAIYAPNKSYGTFDLSDADAITEADYFKYMLAYDLNGLFYFDWHKSAPFNVTLEYVAEYVPKTENLQNAIYGTEVKQYNPSIGARISTNWFYGLLETELIASYGSNNKDGLIMPVVKWKPSWNDNAFSWELRYIGIYGETDYENIGIFRKKDMVVSTLQYNF